jgi:hypothetical protein
MFIINTTIQDIDNGELLPFASVGMTDSKGKLLFINGTYVTRKSDINGKLIIPISDESAYITVSYVGYESITHPADDYRNDIIYLKKKAIKYGGKEIVIHATKPKPKENVNRPKAKPKEKAKTPWLLIAAIGAVAVITGIIIIFKFKK